MAADREEDPTVSFPRAEDDDGQDSLTGQDQLPPQPADEERDLADELGLAEEEPLDGGTFDGDGYDDPEWDEPEETGYVEGVDSEGDETVAAPAAAAAGASAEKRNSRFKAWRSQRPFGAGLLMILAGAVIMSPAYLTMEVQGILISISTISGVSTLIIGVMLVVCGLMTWFKGEGRILTGVVALILSIVALPTSNFGGFVLGTVLAMVGGAWALSWSPADRPEKDGRSRRERRAERKRARSGSAGASAAAAVAVAALMAGHTMTGPAVAHAQPIPGLPEIPGITVPSEDGADPLLPDHGDIGLPNPEDFELPELAELPELPDLGLPEPPEDDPLAFDLTPPIQQEGEMPSSDQIFTITADNTKLIGNVKFSVTSVISGSGQEYPAIRIDADRVELTNLNMEAPTGGVPSANLATGPGQMTTLDGNFSIIVQDLVMTPVIEGLETISIPLDARWFPDELNAALAQIGLGVPDALSGSLEIKDAEMQTYMVRADQLHTAGAGITS